MRRGKELVYDELSIMMEPVSVDYDRWRIACDTDLSVWVEDKARQTEEYGKEFTYHQVEFYAMPGETIKVCWTGKGGIMHLEMRQERLNS